MFIDNLLLRYGSFIIGLTILSFPVFGFDNKNNLTLKDSGNIAKEYEYNSNLLLGLSHSIAKIALTYKSFQKFNGVSDRLVNLLNIMGDIYYRKIYQCSLVDNQDIIYD